ncbi:MAG: hypothetical protein IJF05_05785 [Clostridia bacterium]|nr:hypothetical protein [Clostridia bacterium]
MIKNKRLLIPLVIFLLSVGLGVLFGVRAYFGSEIVFTVDDTLPDGEGRVAHVILLGGQSNASGCSLDEYLERNVTAEKYAEYDAGYGNVYINYYVSDSNVSGGFVKCKTRQGEAATCFGPELGIAERLNEQYPDEDFFIIKCAWGGSNLYEQWLSPSGKGKTGELYKKFTAFVDASVKYLDSKNYDVKIEGMCWMQGESDSFSADHATDYADNLEKLIKDIRRRYKKYASADGIVFVDAYIADLPIFWVYGDLVNGSKRAVAASDPKNLLIDTVAHGLDTTKEPTDSPDVPHYDSMSQIKLGNLFAAELLKFLD